MAEWKKVIVSGSSAELSSLSLDTALTVANGGTGATTLTDGGVLLGSGTGAITATGVLTNGQLLIGDNDGDPTVGTLSEGNGITVSNGAGSITLAIDGTDAVTFSNNASIFSGSFSGSFEGDGSNLTGVSATSFDFDGLTTITSLNGGDFFAASQGGTESKITFANISSSIYGGVSGDATIAADGTLTIAADSVALGTDTTGNYVQSLANATNGGTTITNGSAEGGAATVALDLDDLSAAAVNVANDSIAIIDADDSNATRKERISDLATAMASTGITATGGVFTTNDSEIDHDSLNNFNANEHFTQGDITTVGTVTTGDVSAILPAGTVSASVLSSPGQGQALLTTNGVAGSTIDLGLETGDSPTFANLTISGDLTVQGAVTELQTTNLNVEDQFILLHSGSAANTSDSGIIFGGSGGTAQQGKALIWDSNYAASGEGRLAISTTDVAWNSTTDFAAGTNGYYVAGVFEGTAANAATAQADHNGNIRIETGEIYIYA